MLCTALCAPLPCGEGRTVGTPRRGGRRRGHRRGRRWWWQDSQRGQRGRGHRITQVPVDEARQDRTCVSLSGLWDESCWVEAVCEHSSTAHLSPSVCSTPWHTPALRCSTTPWTLTVDRKQETGNRTEQNSHMSTIDSRNSSQSTCSSASVMHSFHSCCCCATHIHHRQNVFPATPITTSAVWTLLRAVTSTEHGEDLPPQACRARGSTVWTEHSGEDGGARAGGAVLWRCPHTHTAVDRAGSNSMMDK